MNYLRAYCKKSTWLNGELEWQKNSAQYAATYTWFIRSARAKGTISFARLSLQSPIQEKKSYLIVKDFYFIFRI